MLQIGVGIVGFATDLSLLMRVVIGILVFGFYLIKYAVERLGVWFGPVYN
jgi:hypothetical protein